MDEIKALKFSTLLEREALAVAWDSWNWTGIQSCSRVAPWKIGTHLTFILHEEFHQCKVKHCPYLFMTQKTLRLHGAKTGRCQNWKMPPGKSATLKSVPSRNPQSSQSPNVSCRRDKESREGSRACQIATSNEMQAQTRSWMLWPRHMKYNKSQNWLNR